MSASQEKKRRQEQRASGVYKKQVQKNDTLKAQKKQKRIKTAVAAFVILIIVVLVIFNSSLFYTGVTAVKIGDWNFKTAEFNYFYKTIFYNTYSQLYSMYGEYAGMMLDPQKPLDKQQYSEGQTWEEYFEDQTMERMKNMAILVTAAENEGYVLSSEAEDEILNILTDIKASATQNGYPDLGRFLIANYGKGMSEKLANKLVRWEVTAKYYSEELLSRLEYADEELDARYDETASEYDLITFYRYYVDGSANEEEGLDDAAAMNAAYTIANNIAAGHTEETFADLVSEYAPEDEKETYSDPDATRRANVSPSNISDEYKEWLTSTERKYGDTTVIESGSGYYVLLFIESNDNSYHLQNFRHILVKAAVDEETQDVTANTVLAAKQAAEEIYEQWKEEPTEEKFIALASEKSEDPGSKLNGGLYEDVTLGMMVPEIEDWLFSDERKPGDTELIYVNNDSYTGYHIVYDMGDGERQDRKIARELLEQDWFERWLEDQSDDYQIDTTMAFWFAK